MFFLPLCLPQKEIPGLVVLFPGERGVAGVRSVKITVILEEVILCTWCLYMEGTRCCQTFPIRTVTWVK